MPYQDVIESGMRYIQMIATTDLAYAEHNL